MTARKTQGHLGTALAAAAGSIAVTVSATLYTSRPLYGSADAQAMAEITARACIAQFGAGERWARHAHVYACAAGVVDPQHILTYPVAR